VKFDGGVLLTIATQFAVMALLAFGGATAVVPEIHRQAVDLHGWMSNRQFADMFAIAQSFPGPNVMVVTLVGYHVAGLAGAFAATLAMCGPTALLAGVLTQTWDRFKGARWRQIIQTGLVPISVGLVAGSALVLSQVAVHSWTASAIMLATAGVAYWTRWNPLWLLGLAGVAGLFGLV
jgi:chromate transporter